MKFPKNFIETEILPDIENSEAYLYRFTNLDNLMIYLGIHKGYVGDGYWHSSQNEKFNAIFGNSSTKLRYEVLEYGDYKTLTIVERRMLKAVNAATNPLYYNDSNGIAMVKTFDLEKCEELVERILAGEFTQDKERLVSELANLPRAQVRFADDPSHQNEIAQKIDDAGGSTALCSPILLYEKRIGGEDTIGDGNHTVLGANKSKHGRYSTLRVDFIPEEIHKDLSDGDLETIGNLLNPIPEVVDKPTTPKTGVKWVVNRTIEGLPVDSPLIKAGLKKFGFGPTPVKTIIKKAKHELKKAQNARAGFKFKAYHSAPYSSELEAVVDQTKDRNTSCLSMSSAYFKIEEVMKVMEAVPHKKDVVVKLHHPTTEDEEAWAITYYPYWKKKFNFFFKPLGYNVIIDPMDMWEKDPLYDAK